MACSGVPDEILNPRNQWGNKGDFDKTLSHLADLYQACAILPLSEHACVALHQCLIWGPSLACRLADMPDTIWEITLSDQRGRRGMHGMGALC